jgi:uncharacterized membrane-anchored protein
MISKKMAEEGKTQVYVKKQNSYTFGDQTNKLLQKLADTNTPVTIVAMAGTPQGGDISYSLNTPEGRIAGIPAGLLLTSPNKGPKTQAQKA